MTDPSFRCSHASEAPTSRSRHRVDDHELALLEHPGPWGRHALRQARLPHGLGALLQRRERELKIRVLLIRRHGGGMSDPRACFAIHSGPDRPWMERAELDDIAEVAALDLAGCVTAVRRSDTGTTTRCSRSARMAGATRVAPNEAGRSRRPCPSAFPEQTWESTHIGGDRFAGNMIAFPHGFYFGRVQPAEGVEIADGYGRGSVDLAHLRGRSCRPIDVQAAEQFLRADTIRSASMTCRSSTSPEPTRTRSPRSAHRPAYRVASIAKPGRGAPHLSQRAAERPPRFRSADVGRAVTVLSRRAALLDRS